MKLGETAADHFGKPKTYASMSSRSKDQLGTDKKGLLKNISNEHTQKPQENKTQGNIQVSISIDRICFEDCDLVQYLLIVKNNRNICCEKVCQPIWHILPVFF